MNGLTDGIKQSVQFSCQVWMSYGFQSSSVCFPGRGILLGKRDKGKSDPFLSPPDSGHGEIRDVFGLSISSISDFWQG